MTADLELLLKNSSENVFSTFGEKELKAELQNSKNVISITGRVLKPGVYEITPTTTLEEIIQLAGGIKNNKKFKAATIGLPFGGFLGEKDLSKPLTFKDSKDFHERFLLILSEEDCIVAYSKYYVEFLLGKLVRYPGYNRVKESMEKLTRILDRISKGKAEMRDIYLMRNLSEGIKLELKQDKNFILEVIEDFYHELEEHIEELYCKTGQCIQLLKFRITEKCIGCTACVKVCPVHCITGGVKKQHYIDNEYCTECGQCVVACPVNAIFEGDHSIHFLREIAISKIVAVQIAPAVRVTIGEAFGFKIGENVEKKLVGALKKIGVDYVFDTAWAADVTVMEEAAEFQERLEKYLADDDSRSEERRVGKEC